MEQFLDILPFHASWTILALRLVLGIIFLVHGRAKRAMWKMSPSEQMSAGMIKLMRILSIIEPIAGILMILGLFTHLSALAMGIIMLGALRYKIAVWKMPFMAQNNTGWEFDLLILASALVIFVAGPGALSAASLVAFFQ